MNTSQNSKRKKKIGRNRIPISPNFHIRNIMGNFWSNFIGLYGGSNPYCKGFDSRGKTATETMSFLYNYPCSSPLGLAVMYKTFKVFGIIIHIPAFWRRRIVKGIPWPDETDLIPFPLNKRDKIRGFHLSEFGTIKRTEKSKKK